MLPSPSDLTYFMEIAHARSLSQAAVKLGVTQPSLTLAMQRLEHCLGSQLFLRSRSGMTLTKAGELLMIETRSLLEAWDKLQSRSARSMNDVRGRFTLGCHVSVGRYALPLFVPEIMQAYPDLDLRLHHDLSRRVLQQVVTLELDLGIVINPESHPDLVMKTLGMDTVTLWKSKELKNSDVLIIEPSLLQTQSLMRRLKKSGWNFRRVIETSSLEIIAALTKSGAGYGMLPARVARFGASEKLTMVKDAPKVEDQIVLIYRVENKSVRAIQELSKRIQAGFAVL